MSSSTSSSRRDPVWAGLALGLALLAVYEGVIRAGRVPPGEGTNQNQVNVVHLEQLAHMEGEVPLVLVGSSLTYNLPEGLICKGAINAGLGGGSTRTGLEALLRSKLRPKIVLVEMNAPLLREPDMKAIDQLFNPVTEVATDDVRAFQQRFQPVNVVATRIRRKAYRGGAGRPDRKVSPSVTRDAIRSAVAEGSHPLTPFEHQQLGRALEDVRREAATLVSRGTIVVFQTIPGEPSVDATVKEQEVRSETTKAFPPSAYRWIPPLAGRTWHTNDGTHLVPADAEVYARYINTQLRTRGFIQEP